MDSDDSGERIQRLRVLTLNIWNRQGGWEERLPLIRAGIERLAPDLVGLQEVLRFEPAPSDDDNAPARPPDQAEEIAAGLGYHVAYGAAWHIGGGLHFGNAILSRYPIHDEHVIGLPTGQEEPRALLGAEIDSPWGRIPFFVTHLNWQFDQGIVRQAQVGAIARHIEARAPSPSRSKKDAGQPARTDLFPPILVGDFNAEPLSDEIRFLYGWHALDGTTVYYADCFAVAGDGGAGHTFAKRNPQAASVHEPDRRIDYIFVRGPDRRFAGEPLACRVVLDEPAGGVFPSDHFGVYAELSTGDRKTR